MHQFHYRFFLVRTSLFQNSLNAFVLNATTYFILYSYIGIGLLHLVRNDFLWSPYVIGQAIIFLPSGYYLLLLSFFPRLISAVANWMSAILPHMVWPWCEFRMQDWNVLHGARCKYRTQKDRHLRTIAQLCRAIWCYILLYKLMKAVRVRFYWRLTLKHTETLSCDLLNSFTIRYDTIR